MWRNITRGLKKSLKKSPCLEKGDDFHGRRTSACCRKCCVSEFLPGALHSLRLCASNLGDGDNFKQDSYKRTSKDRPVGEHSFLEAFGWSGALVFGWIISKQWWLKYNLAQDRDRPTPFKSPNGCVMFDQRFIQLLAQIAKTQPPITYVLPQLKSDLTHYPPKTVESKPFKSVDEEFEAAAKSLREIHEKAIGESLNRRGIACLSHATGSEAISFFQRAAEMKYPAASFNMGQCCELGIGIQQDFKQAADWYKIASEQGHATAKYNLGVFYAHGWGGLAADIDAAKTLFVEAAKLGQPDAVAALDKESRYLFRSLSECIPKLQPELCTINHSTKLALHKSNWKLFLNNLIADPSGDDAIRRTIDIFKSSVQ